VDIDGDIGPPLSERQREEELGSGSVGDDWEAAL
jgi:hypothetical protein